MRDQREFKYNLFTFSIVRELSRFHHFHSHETHNVRLKRKFV